MSKNTMLIGLGVVGLGVAGLVLLSSKKAAASTQPTQTPQQPVGPQPAATTPPQPVPPTASAASTAPGTSVVSPDGRMIHYRNGSFYRGRMNLAQTGTLPFTAGSPTTETAKGLSALGFSHVAVFGSLSELPSAPGGAWPASVTAGAGPGTRWFQGVWMGPTQDVPRPAHVEQVWQSLKPAFAPSGGQTVGA